MVVVLVEVEVPTLAVVLDGIVVVVVVGEAGDDVGVTSGATTMSDEPHAARVIASANNSRFIGRVRGPR